MLVRVYVLRGWGDARDVAVAVAVAVCAAASGGARDLWFAAGRLGFLGEEAERHGRNA